MPGIASFREKDRAGVENVMKSLVVIAVRTEVEDHLSYIKARLGGQTVSTWARQITLYLAAESKKVFRSVLQGG